MTAPRPETGDADAPTADPPNATLAHLPANGLIVQAVIYNPANGGAPLRLDLGKACHLKCCESAYVAGGNYELTGYGPRHPACRRPRAATRDTMKTAACHRRDADVPPLTPRGLC